MLDSQPSPEPHEVVLEIRVLGRYVGLGEVWRMRLHDSVLLGRGSHWRFLSLSLCLSCTSWQDHLRTQQEAGQLQIRKRVSPGTTGQHLKVDIQPSVL